MGTQLGREAQALGVNVLLGPGINMKRSPYAEEILSTILKILIWQGS